MKPTLINGFLAILFAVLLRLGRNPLKLAVGGAVQVSEALWDKLAKRWIGLFIVIAVLNEFIWRNYEEHTWVAFRSLGILGINAVFMVMQVPLVRRNWRVARAGTMHRYGD
jgi:intracellular septation protein